MSQLSLPLLWVCLLSPKRDFTESWDGAWRALCFIFSHWENPDQPAMLCNALLYVNWGDPELTCWRDETRSPWKGKWFWCGLRLRRKWCSFTEMLSVTAWYFTLLTLTEGWFGLQCFMEHSAFYDYNQEDWVFKDTRMNSRGCEEVPYRLSMCRVQNWKVLRPRL